MKTSPTVLGNQARICREDPLPQPPYVLLGLAPVHLVPVREAVLWSVHRDGADASAPGVPLMVSNLPFGSGVSACFPPQAHQARVSALSGRDMVPVRPVMREPLAEEPVHAVPVSRCLSAAGIRFSGLPAPAGELSLPHVRPTGRRDLPDPNGVVTFRLVEVRPGWVPPGPRGRWFAPGRSLDTGQHLPPSSGGPCSPALALRLREST